MYSFLLKYGQALAFGIGVLIVVIFLASIFSADDSLFTALAANDKEPETYETSIFDIGFYATIGLLILAFAAAIIFGIAQMASNPKGSLKGIAGLIGLLLILFVCYSAVSGEVTDPAIADSIENFETTQGSEITESTLKFISGSMITALVLIGLAILALIAFGIRGIFK